jgi:hypothetical protein
LLEWGAGLGISCLHTFRAQAFSGFATDSLRHLFNIRNHSQFVEKLRYIHRNPVKRELCARPEDWEWSSFRHYSTGCEGIVEIESEWTARKRERAACRLCDPTQAKEA